MNQQKKNVIYIYVILDLLAAAISWTLLYVFRKYFVEDLQTPIGVILSETRYYQGLLVVSLFWINLFYVSGTYVNVYRKSRIKEIIKTFVISLIGCTIIFFGLILDDIVKDYTSYYISASFLFACQFLLTLFFRLIVLNYSKMQLRRGTVFFNTLIIGSNHNAVNLYNSLIDVKKSTGNKFIGFVEVNNRSANGLKEFIPQLGSVDHIKSIIQKNQVEEVIIAIETQEHHQINEIINELADTETVIKIIPDMYDILSGFAKMNNVLGDALIEIYPDLMPRWEKNVKRIIDIVASSIAILLLLPVYIFTAIKVKLSSPGDILYKQERIGINGKPFFIYKFRSMFVDAESNGPALSSKNDARITNWGKIMRKWRLDEIPQFFNVLIGDMSLVGPRPERKYFIDQIIQQAPHYKHISKVKPGITSLGMVKYGYAENVEEMIQRLKFDIIYIENISIILDIKILFYTISTVIQGRGK
ncbi:MAG: sugar transferase [Bacteroidota bacterium]